jgi:23S rRNA (guanosine2251-2'-O)-methyltransferase
MSGRPDRENTVVYGSNAVREALRGPRRVHEVWAAERAATTPWLAGTRVRRVSAEELERLCGSPDHQGLGALVDRFEYAIAEELLAEPDPLIIALDEIQDPQNLGAICRTAEAAGAAGVVLPERRAAGVTPAVCRASAGAVEHLRVAQVRNLADFLKDAKEAGCWVYGAAADAPVSYDQPDYRGGVVLVLGAEGKGLRPRVAESCDALVALPLKGKIQSLNVSAAAAALVYAILQRQETLDNAP